MNLLSRTNTKTGNKQTKQVSKTKIKQVNTTNQRAPDDVAEGRPKQKPPDPLEKFLGRFEKIKLKDMVVFSKQFSAMIGSGVAMLRTLTIIAEQCENKKLKVVLEDIRRQVESGSNLSDAVARYPEVFDRLFVAMVKAGEVGGILDEVMRKVAEFMEAREKLNQKVKSAMAYPMVALSIAVLVFWGMLTFILPIFQKIFKDLGGELPAFTQMLIDLSTLMRSFWMVIFVGLIVFASWSIRTWYKTKAGQFYIDGLLLKVPVFGDVIRKVAVARFTRTFGTLIRSGVPMLTALDVVKETAGNAVLAVGVQKVQTEVSQGGTISKPLSRDSLFPPMVTQMVAVGEETGRLDDMLSKVADFYDVEVESSVEAMTSVLEPIMVVGIGGIVGSVVVGLYLPIFTIINQIR